MLEKNIQSRITKYLSKKENLFYIKYVGAKKGTPDIICCYKGQFIGLEVKRDKKAPISKMQLYQKEVIEKSGGKYYFVYSLRDVKNILK